MVVARKKTREELEREVARLQATEEAFYALMRGPASAGRMVTVANADGETPRSVSVLGIERAAGGVVVFIDGEPCAPQYLCDWCQRIEANPHVDPYRRDVANKARKAQAEAARSRETQRPHVAVDAMTREDHVRSLVDIAYRELVAAREYVMGPEVRQHTNKSRRALAWALRVHLGVAVRASDDPSGNGGAPKEVRS